MTSLSKALGDVFSDCKDWIARNPSKVRTWEWSIYNIAQFLLGKFNNTKLQNEWLRSAFKLVSLFNQLIILHSSTKKPYDTTERINICIAVLEHCEIAIEKSAQALWGTEGKWSTVKYLLIIKFLAKVTLVLHFKEKLIGHPCAEVGKLGIVQSNCNGQEFVEYRSNNVLRLKRSGRIMRTVASAPPLWDRQWKPPVMNFPVGPNFKDVNEEERAKQAVGELLYIIKPIVNLMLIRRFGNRKWKQWTLSLFLDLLSMNLLQFPSGRGNCPARLTPVEMLTLAERRSNLLFYLIRSPFFQKRIANPLYLIVYMIPYVGPILSSELRFYLSSYLFLWST